MSWKDKFRLGTPAPTPPAALTQERRTEILNLIAANATDDELRIIEKLYHNNPVRREALAQASKYL